MEESIDDILNELIDELTMKILETKRNFKNWQVSFFFLHKFNVSIWQTLSYIVQL